jgi:hypothetical protein
VNSLSSRWLVCHELNGKVYDMIYYHICFNLPGVNTENQFKFDADVVPKTHK